MATTKDSILHRYDGKEEKDEGTKIKIKVGKQAEAEEKKEAPKKGMFGMPIGNSAAKKEEKAEQKARDADKFMSQEGFDDNENTGIRISNPPLTPDKIEAQRKKFCGMDYKTMMADLARREQEVINSLPNFVSESFLETAEQDLRLVYDTILRPIAKFTYEEGFSVCKQILKRVEKVVASDPEFYRHDDRERMQAFMKEITNYIPTQSMQTYGDMVATERRNPFSIYYNLLQDICAQDFIITGDFLNVQYKLGEYFYIDIPEYLKELNGLFVDHICVDYMYSRNEKFGPKDAIKDMEDQGFRFNFIHKQIVATGYSIMFIRKNTHGISASVAGSSYYIDLLSEMDATMEEKEKLIERMRDLAARKNFLVVGPTGSGKTTLLRQMLLDRQREQNLITIEDTRELYLPNAVAYLTDKDHTIHDIFVSTLRMNPSRVVVGETRDVTIIDILEVCLTARSATTLHATDMDKCISRIHQMCRSANVTPDELDFLISSAIDMFVFIIDRKIKGIYIRDPQKHFDAHEGIFACYETAYLFNGGK